MAGLAIAGRRCVVGLLRRGRSFASAAEIAYEAENWDDFPAYTTVEEVRRESYSGRQWVFLGCPGVGKGTYAGRLAVGLRIPHIAMGDLVKRELTEDSPMSKELASLMERGKLLPDELVLALLTKRLEESAAVGDAGFILEGFPRTKSQAKTLDAIANIELVVNLKLREDVLIARCLGRRICSQCGNCFNFAKIDAPETETCPAIKMPQVLPPKKCNKKMTRRPDDTEEIIRERLQAYAQQSKPVEDYYRSQGKVIDFEILGGIPETWTRLLTALNLQNTIAQHVSLEPQRVNAGVVVPESLKQALTFAEAKHHYHVFRKHY